MKLKLLFTGLVFSAFTANAQVATLNENFNNFTAGNTALPQNGWSAVLPAATGNPGPMMIVFAEGAEKNIQSYSGSNSNTPQYLVSPQIVAPTGNKSVSFKARKNVAGAPVTVQVGLASSATDMTTFVALGSPVVLFTNVYQTITVAVPSSASTYLVFKTVNANPGVPHTAADIDDVVYNTTASLSVSDSFGTANDVKFAVNTENTALQFVGKVQPKNVEIYSAAGQKVEAGKVNNSIFDIAALQAGVYYVLIETTEGKALKSKFIKK